MTKKRKEAGWAQLNGWIKPDSAAKLNEICKTLNVTKYQAIERLLLDL